MLFDHVDLIQYECIFRMGLDVSGSYGSLCDIHNKGTNGFPVEILRRSWAAGNDDHTGVLEENIR